MATTTQKAEWIERMTERIVKNFDPQKVILFGSQVRGDASEESDIDQPTVRAGAVVLRRRNFWLVSRDAPGNRSAAARPQHSQSFIWLPIGKDIIVTSCKKVARRGHIVGSVLNEALREGVVLYERRWNLCRS